MFNFFGDVKKAIVDFKNRIVNLEHKVEMLFQIHRATGTITPITGDTQTNAKQEQEASTHDGGGGTQSELRQEDGNTANSGEGVQPSGSGEVAGEAPAEQGQ